MRRSLMPQFPRRLPQEGAGIMKAEIHPEYTACKVTCACGNVFETRSTKKAIKVDICGACHPFFTGAQKFVDTAGRVDTFRRRYGETKASPVK